MLPFTIETQRVGMVAIDYLLDLWDHEVIDVLRVVAVQVPVGERLETRVLGGT